MPDPKPKCFTCDNGCLDNPYNPDEECIGRATIEERKTLARLMVSLAQPQQTYGAPQEMPPARISEAQKHHITRSGR